jgi:hypothetical protein
LESVVENEVAKLVCASKISPWLWGLSVLKNSLSD